MSETEMLLAREFGDANSLPEEEARADYLQAVANAPLHNDTPTKDEE